MPAVMSQVGWGIDDAHDVVDKPTRGISTNGGALSGTQEPGNLCSLRGGGGAVGGGKFVAAVDARIGFARAPPTTCRNL